MATSDLPLLTLSAEQIADETLRLAAEVSGVGYWDIDPVDDITVWDTRTREVLGIPPDTEVDQAMFYEVLHPDDRDRVRAEVQAAFDPAVATYDTEYRVNTEPIRWVRARGHAYFDDRGRPIRFIGIVLDITADKQREQELSRLTKEAQAQNEAKDEFLAKLGHELRNPLSPIAVGVALLRERGNDDPALRAIDRHVKHLSRLVDDLLDVARIAHRKVRLERAAVRFGDVVKDATSSVEEKMEASKQRMDVDAQDTDAVIHVDPDRLQQVLANVLDNASKFSPPGATIHLACRIEDADAVIEIRDEGIGVAPERLTTLFQTFSQEPQPFDRPVGGLGLGLSIVKGLVELHGGRVEASSAGVDAGMTVTIRIPKDGPIESQPEAAVLATPTEAKRILVVDDNRDLCDMLAELLEIRGHTVCIAYDGHEAIAAVRSFEPDVAFVDLGLPGLDGYEVATRVHAELASPPPLVAMSGYGQEQDRVRSKSVGFSRHLVKPVAVATVFEAIAELT